MHNPGVPPGDQLALNHGEILSVPPAHAHVKDKLHNGLDGVARHPDPIEEVLKRLKEAGPANGPQQPGRDSNLAGTGVSVGRHKRHYQCKLCDAYEHKLLNLSFECMMI
jgi:hypothetical protein